MSTQRKLMVPKVSTALDTFRREMNDMMERSFGFDGLNDQMSPRFDVSETDKQFEVNVDLPGMKADDFNVEFDHGELWISGERKSEHEDKGKTWHRIERSHGAFRRGIPLNDAVKADDIQADYKDGVLRVVVPKDEKARPKKIPISAK